MSGAARGGAGRPLRARFLVAMAARNAARQRRRSLLLGGAVGFAAFVMSLVSGFAAGMEGAVQDNVTLSVGGHLLVTGLSPGRSGRPQARIRDAAGLASRAAAALPWAVSVAPAASAQASLVFGPRQQRLRLSGVDWSVDRLYRGSLTLVAGDWEAAAGDRALVMPRAAADRLGASVGDVLIARLTTASGQRTATEYVVRAVYDDAAAGGALAAYAGFGDLASDLGLGEGESQALAVFLPDARGAPRAADSLAAALGAARGSAAAPSFDDAESFGLGAGGAPSFSALEPGAAAPRAAAPEGALWVATIGDLAGQAGELLGVVSWIGYAVFAAMLALAAAGIANTFRMVLLERTREIGTLRCIGFRRRQVFLLVVAEAEGISLLGAAAGIAAAIPLGCLAGLLRLPPNSDASAVLSAGRLPFSPDPASLAVILAGVAVMAFAAASGPARAAAGLRPAEALRAVA